MENATNSLSATRKLKVVTVLGMLALTLGVAGGKAQALPTLFPTGVDASGNPLPVGTGAADLHYTVLPTLLPGVVTDNQVVGLWAQSPNSRWIWDTANGQAVGTRTFRTSFTLTAGEAASPLLLSGIYTADNTIDVYLNGNLVAPAPGPGYNQFASFSVTSGFGTVNILDFVVNNTDGPGGLNVSQLSIVSAAPEPTTLALLALGGLGILGKRFRRREG